MLSLSPIRVLGSSMVRHSVGKQTFQLRFIHQTQKLAGSTCVAQRFSFASGNINKSLPLIANLPQTRRFIQSTAAGLNTDQDPKDKDASNNLGEAEDGAKQSKPPPRKNNSRYKDSLQMRYPKNEFGQVMTYEERRQAGLLTPTQKVVEAGKDFTYLMVVIAGLGLCAIFGYSALSELFSQHSPSTVYSKTSALVTNDERIKAMLGDNIKVTAHATAHRERIPSHVEYEVNGEIYMRMRFFLTGEKGSGTVHLETKDDKPNFVYRYLFVEVPGQGLPSQNIVLYDNR